MRIYDWPKCGDVVQLRWPPGMEGSWVGRGSVIGPVGDTKLGDTDIPALWRVRIIHHPSFAPGDFVDFDYLDILGVPVSGAEIGVPVSLATPVPVAPTPLVLRLRADKFDQGCQRAAALIPYLAEPHAGILMIPEATQSDADIAPHAFNTAGGFDCMYCGRPARDHVSQEVDPS